MGQRPDAPPIAVTAIDRNAVRIVAHEVCAARFGIHIGQTLADARALLPELEHHIRAPEAETALLHSLAAWCGRYTPLVALDSTDDTGLLLDVTGCTHLFGGEQASLSDLETRLAAQGFTVRICMADTAGAAWAMARFGTARHIASGAQARAIAPLPLHGLRVTANLVEGLSRVGLKTIGCIMDLPRAPLTARFGKQLLFRLDQALGMQDEAISPLCPVPELASEQRFAEPITSEDHIRHAIALMAANLTPLLQRRGLGTLVCQLQLYRVDGEVFSLEVNAANPLRDPARITGLFADRILRLHTDLDAGFGFDIARLNVLEAAPLAATQNDLTGQTRNDDLYNALVDRLGARLGIDRVLRFTFTDSHIPEHRFALHPVAGPRRHKLETPDLPLPSRIPTRPLILLERPEPVDAIAQVPDNPPSRFRWRKVTYEVIRAEGPERIACEWWRDGRAAKTRDYFRIEDTTGHRFWLFRHGLYGRETARPGWYMHGLFA